MIRHKTKACKITYFKVFKEYVKTTILNKTKRKVENFKQNQK